MRGVRVEATSGSTMERVWRALERDPRIGARAHPLTLALDDGTLVIEGEVADVAAKTRAVELAQVFPEIHRVVDRILVEAPVKMEDGSLRDLYERAILGEIAFVDSRFVLRAEGVDTVIHDPPSPRGDLLASVASAVFTLSGTAPSLAHARLAGVLAWWIPGTRSVVNELRAEPPEEDTDDEINDAVRTALEKEPLLDADQLVIRTAGGRVTLAGTLPSEEQRQIAARDAWYVLGVLDVDDRIQVHITR